MYFKNFKFTRKPFDNTSDPDFYYLTDSARKTYDRIAHAIEQHAPHVVISGEPGTGKTTLLNRLMSARDPNVHWIYITRSALTWPELLFAIGRSLKVSGITPDADDLEYRIASRLDELIKRQMIPVLIIDEAQCLEKAALSALFAWQTQINMEGIGVTVILAGQNELPPILADLQSPDFTIGTTNHCRLEKLTLAECRAMIAHRLKMAGYIGPALFSKRTSRTIFSISGGVPRRVITICDLAMFTAAAHTGDAVSPKDIRDISEYILRTAVDTTEKSRLPKTIPSGSKSKSLSQSATESTTRWPLGDVSIRWQWLAPLKTIMINQWAHISKLRPKSWPWKKALAELVKPTLKKRLPLFRPWGYAATFLLIVLGGGYVWLHAPPLESYPTAAVDSRPVDHGLIKKFKIDVSAITPEVKPIHQAIAPERLTRSDQEKLEIASLKNENVEEAIEIAEILAVPEWVADKAAIDKEKPAPSLVLAKAADVRLAMVSPDHQIQISTVSILQPELNQTEISRLHKDSPMPAKQTSATLTSPPPTEPARVAAKTVKPVKTIKKTQPKKPNRATKVLSKGIQDGHFDSVRKALLEGADPDAVFSKDKTALTASIDGGHLEIVRMLVDLGAAINQPTPSGETALMKAAWTGHAEMTALLIDRGASINLQNREGWTSLFYASITGRSDIVKTLLNGGARWDLTDRDGRTPLMAAAWNGHLDIVGHLLSAGADPNRKDRDGWTPLMFAAFVGHTKVGKMLLSNGADLSLKNNSDQTSGDLATQQGHSELFAMITNHIQ